MNSKSNPSVSAAAQWRGRLGETLRAFFVTTAPSLSEFRISRVSSAEAFLSVSIIVSGSSAVHLGVIVIVVNLCVVHQLATEGDRTFAKLRRPQERRALRYR